MKRIISAGGSCMHMPKLLPLILFILCSLAVRAQIKWTNTGASTSWFTASNWTPATAAAGWLPGSVAQFDNTGTATVAGINMGVSSLLSIAAIYTTDLRTRNLTIGNSSTTPGTLQLNGDAGNVIIKGKSGLATAYQLTLQDNATGTGKTMNIALGNPVENIIMAGGIVTININSAISGAGKNLTIAGAGESGRVYFSGANTYTGLTTIGPALRGVTLALNRTGGATLPATNDVTIKSLGELKVNTNQTLRNVVLSDRGILTVADGVTLTITEALYYRGGSISLGTAGTGKIVYAPGAALIYDGSLPAVTTSAKEFPAVNGPSRLVVNQNINLHDHRSAGSLALTGYVQLGANDLTVTGSISTTGGRVVTNGAGKLIINNIGSCPVVFPVAVSSTAVSNPVTISNGQGLNYGVRVEAGIAPPVLNPAIAINRTWYIIPNAPPSAVPVNISFYYTNADANAGFNPMNRVQLGQFTTSWSLAQNNLAPISPLQTAVSTLVGSTNCPFVIGNMGAVQ